MRYDPGLPDEWLLAVPPGKSSGIEEGTPVHPRTEKTGEAAGDFAAQHAAISSKPAASNIPSTASNQDHSGG